MLGELEIGHELSGVTGEKFRYGFEFNNNAAVDQSIESEPCIELDIFINHWQSHLTIDG